MIFKTFTSYTTKAYHLYWLTSGMSSLPGWWKTLALKPWPHPSGAIADSLGYKDGEQIPFDELCYVVKTQLIFTTL